MVIYRDPSGMTSDAYGRSRDYIPRWIGPGTISDVLGSGMYKITIQRFGSRPSTFLRNVALILPFTGEIPAIAPTRDNQCTASIATTGQRCTATARPNGFCGRHQGHADQSIASARLNNANRCTAIVAATGRRCTATAKFNDKCGRHRDEPTPASTNLVRVVIRAYEQVVLCACAACCWCATMRLVSWMKLSRFADEKLFGCG